MKLTRLFPLVLTMTMVACATPTAQSLGHTVGQPLDKRQTWQLTAIQGRDVDPGSKVTTLVINTEAGTATGHACCNTYTFRCALKNLEQQLDGDYYDLDLTLWESGSLACPEAEKNAEARYLMLLAKATRLRLTATTLTLFQKDKEILHFELR